MSIKVEIVKIDSITNHENADKLEIAHIKGWTCVIPKDIYKPGSVCVYIPIDSILPKGVEDKIFPPESKIKLDKSRVRTIKLRGVVSQGLVVDPKLFGLENLPVGRDVTKILGITKFEPPVNEGPSSNCNIVSKEQMNPHFHKYTSIENFKNYTGLEIFKAGEDVIISEKVHGSSHRAGFLPTTDNTLIKKFLKFIGVLPRYEFVYGSHNVQLQNCGSNHKENIYYKVVEKYNLKNKLKDGEVIYGEVYGSSVQKNYHYGCAPGEIRYVAFDVMVNNRYLNHEDFIKFCKERDIPHVPILYKGAYYPTLVREFASGESILDSSQKIIEGVVIKPPVEQYTQHGRKVLKLINDQYLLQKTNTDFH